MLGVEQALSLAPDPVAAAVEDESGDALDGLASAGLAYAVIAGGGVELTVVHQLTKHVDGHPGVRVALGVAVAIGVERDPAPVEGRSLRGGQGGKPVNPLTMGEPQAERGDGVATVGVAPVSGQQLQLAGRRGRKAGGDSGLLGDDHLGGGLGDRQAPLEPVCLVVVIPEGAPLVKIASSLWSD